MSISSKLERWGSHLAIIRAMRRPAPGSYPLTGPAVASRDFFDVTLVDPEGDAVLSARSVSGGTSLSGYWFTGNGRGGYDREERTISLEQARTMPLRIRYLYGGEDHTFRSAWTYLLGGETRVKLRWYLTRLFRGVSHLQSLARQDRMRILQVVVDHKIEGDSPTSTVDVLVALHNHRWLFHPQKDAQMRHIRMVLQSLVATDDLLQQEAGYVPSPKALATLHVHETEQKRFDSQNFQSKVISVLTVILVVIGLAQAYAALVPRPVLTSQGQAGANNRIP